MIRVHLFAALADAAGTHELEVEPCSIDQLRADLSARFGEPFTSRLARSRAWVDGEDVTGDTVPADGAEVALLPPFAGG